MTTSIIRKLVLILLFCSSALADNLVQNQIQTRRFVLLDSTTGLPKTGVTVTGITGTISKSRGLAGVPATTKTTFTCAASGSPNDCVEVGGGQYDIEFSAANCDTLRDMEVSVTATGALTTTRHFYVVADASDQVNAQGNISDNGTIAAAVKALLDAAYATNWGFLDAPITSATTSNPNLNPNFTTGTAQGGTATTITLAATESATDNIFKNSYIVIKSGTGAFQWALITAYNGTTKVATITCAQTVNGSWLIIPVAADSVYSIFAKGR